MLRSATEDVMIGKVEWMVLFVAYALVGFVGDQTAQFLLGESDRTMPGPEVVRVAVPAEVDVPTVRAEVEEVRVDVQLLGSGPCRFEVERPVSLDVSAARWLRVDAGAGSLVVEGREGLDRVQAVGRACASEEAWLDDLRLTLERDGDDLVLSAHYPDRAGRWSRNGYARIDLAVEVPRGMAVDVDDSSGEIAVSGSGELRIDDSSGSIDLRDIQGPVRIEDGSGSIEVSDVFGDLDVEDGSGGLEIEGVQGNVRIRDGSGSIRADAVTGNVVVEGDGSGSISVDDVGGDFRVLRDGSGGIRHSGVAGAVDIPQRRRRR